MKWTKKKKIQTAAIILLAVGFAAGGLTVYANGLNRRAQAIFTGGTVAENFGANRENGFSADSGQGQEQSLGQQPGGGYNPSGGQDDENTGEREEKKEGGVGPGEADEKVSNEEGLSSAASDEEKVATVSSDPLRKAQTTRREEQRVVDPSRPMVALTYDDGPYPAVTDRIMDSLAEHGGKATFFVVGNRVGNFPETMKRIAAEGHELGNHSYTHTKFTSLDEEGIRKELNDTQYIVTFTTDVVPELLRLPYGAKNDLVVASAGMPMIQWSLDTLDWKTRDAQSTINRVLETVKDGDIILMHDLYPATAEASETLIPELISRGFQLVTVSELLASRGVELDGAALYYNAPMDSAQDDGNVEKEVELYEKSMEEQK